MEQRHLGALVALVFLLLPQVLLSDDFKTFDDFLARYKEAKSSECQELADSYIRWQQSRGGFPVVEQGGNVVFLYSAGENEKDIRLIGEFKPRSFYNASWDPQGEAMLAAAENSSLFYKKLQFEQDARLDYKFSVDGKYVTDPLNPRTSESGTAPMGKDEQIAIVSELVMPQYQLPPSVRKPDTPRGKLIAIEEEWMNPKVTVYLPPNYDPAIKYPVLYTADGQAWIHFIRLPVILDNLISDGKIEPIIAVLIDSKEDRRTWYYYNADYLSYIEKVIRFMDTNYSTRTRAEDRFHAGTSAGGAIALYTGFERPDLFGNLALLSPSLTGPPHYYEPYFSGSKKPDPKLNIWLSAGTYEPYIHQDALTMERYFKKTNLRTKVTYTHEGHTFGTWRKAAAGMLLYFFAR